MFSTCEMELEVIVVGILLQLLMEKEFLSF